MSLLRSRGFHEVHVNLADLEAILRRQGDPLLSKLFLHQLASCPECYRRAGEVLDLYREGWLPTAELTRGGIALARSRRSAPQLLEQLEAWPFLEQMERLRRGGSFASWGLAELLCRRSLSTAAEDANGALEYAFLAEEIAKGARCSGLQDSARSELAMLVSAHIGNGLRLNERLSAAQELFDTAEGHWASIPTPQLPYRPWVLSLRAGLEIEAGRLDFALGELLHAHRLLDDAPHPFATAMDEHALRTRLFLQEARLRALQDQWDRALRLQQRAQDLLSKLPENDLSTPHLETESRLLQASTLADLGRLDDALASLDAGLPSNPLDDLRKLWLSARIQRHRGGVAQARESLEQVRRGFLRHRLLDAARIVTLELVELLLEHGDSDRARRLAAECAAPVGEGVEKKIPHWHPGELLPSTL
ncbi:MAG: hypothetical protein AAGD01_13570 [Acidobacteriota bacterium]